MASDDGDSRLGMGSLGGRLCESSAHGLPVWEASSSSAV